MRLRQMKLFLGSVSARLAGTYLSIIMVMSIGFSLALYGISSHELGRQIPPDSFFDNSLSGTMPPPSVHNFLERRIHEGRSDLIIRLLLLNVITFLLGSILSYILARRTLQPIEEAMDAQTQFVSDASHELRTPLTAIQTSNEVGLRNPKLTLSKAKELIKQNTDDVVKLKNLSDGLLNLASNDRQPPALQPLNVQDALSDALTVVATQATAKHISVVDDVENANVLAAHDGLTQVLVILLDNAVKYSEPGSSVYLETAKKGKQLLISVRDAGIGIRASDMPHIFRRFYRADNARSSVSQGGYGLGLAIAKQIIESQHGSIQASSKLGTGSTFTIRLPLANTSIE